MSPITPSTSGTQVGDSAAPPSMIFLGEQSAKVQLCNDMSLAVTSEGKLSVPCTLDALLALFSFWKWLGG